MYVLAHYRTAPNIGPAYMKRVLKPSQPPRGTFPAPVRPRTNRPCPRLCAIMWHSLSLRAFSPRSTAINASRTALVTALSATAVQAFSLLGSSWSGAPGTPAAVTYSYFDSGITANGDVGSLSRLWGLNGVVQASWRTEIGQALADWTAASGGNLTFSEVADLNDDWNLNNLSGQIRFAAENIDGAAGVLAHAFQPGVNGGGDTHFDTAENWTVNSLDMNTATIDITQVATHEIGHAIGLDHTSTPNSLLNPVYTEAFSGTQTDDVNGVRYLYDPAYAGPGPVAFAGSAPESPLLALLSMPVLAIYMSRQRARAKPPAGGVNR